jgi:hypothetical protein
MLRDLDETIKQILIRAGGFDTSQVDISFNIPNREWSEKLGARPALNCYLFDIHERRALREEGWRVESRNGHESRRRQPPLFFEMTYLITAWTKDIADEHILLWNVLETLVRFPTLNDPAVILETNPREDVRENRWLEPEAAADAAAQRPRLVECLQGELAEYPWPISAQIAQMEGVLKSPGEFWTALENHLKPSLSYVITLGLDRQAMRAGNPVLASGLSIRLPESSAEAGFRLSAIFHIPSGTAIQGVQVRVEGQRTQATADADGWFQLPGLAPGHYTLAAEIGGRLRRRMVALRDPADRSRRAIYHDVVRDHNRDPIGGVRVLVEGTDLSAVTDTAGRFSLDLPPGQYTLVVELDDWVQRRQIRVRDTAYTTRLEYGGVPPQPKPLDP